jgi:hypothetical protein
VQLQIIFGRVAGAHLAQNSAWSHGNFQPGSTGQRNCHNQVPLHLLINNITIVNLTSHARARSGTAATAKPLGVMKMHGSLQHFLLTCGSKILLYGHTQLSLANNLLPA